MQLGLDKIARPGQVHDRAEGQRITFGGFSALYSFFLEGGGWWWWKELSMFGCFVTSLLETDTRREAILETRMSLLSSFERKLARSSH